MKIIKSQLHHQQEDQTLVRLKAHVVWQIQDVVRTYMITQITDQIRDRIWWTIWDQTQSQI